MLWVLERTTRPMGAVTDAAAKSDPSENQKLAQRKPFAMTSPLTWHTDPVLPPSNKPFYHRTCETDITSLGWTLKEGPKGYQLSSVNFPGMVSFTSVVQVMDPPSRWMDRPENAATVRLASPELISFIEAAEAWIQPSFRDPLKSLVHRNVFNETFVRAKLMKNYRLYSDGKYETEGPIEAGQFCIMASLKLWRMNGEQGLSIVIHGLEPHTEPEPLTEPPTKRQRK